MVRYAQLRAWSPMGVHEITVISRVRIENGKPMGRTAACRLCSASWDEDMLLLARGQNLIGRRKRVRSRCCPASLFVRSLPTYLKRVSCRIERSPFPCLFRGDSLGRTDDSWLDCCSCFSRDDYVSSWAVRRYGGCARERWELGTTHGVEVSDAGVVVWKGACRELHVP